MRPLITAATLGWVYLLHFARPLGNLRNPRGQAQHYVGFATDVDERVGQQLAGIGARITRAAVAQGIEISLVAAWQAPLSFEKHLKRLKNAPRYCPVCCRQHGRRPRQPAIAVEQLAFDFQEDVEPWPEGFEFPAPTLARPTWAEFQRVRTIGAPVGGDWDDGLL